MSGGSQPVARWGFAFVPVDDAARDGGFHLLRDSSGAEHCARWDKASRRFAYSSGAPLSVPVTEYCRATRR